MISLIAAVPWTTAQPILKCYTGKAIRFSRLFCRDRPWRTGRNELWKYV